MSELYAGPLDPEKRNAAARAGADGVNRGKLKNSAQNIAPRAGRVQHGATAAAARHYVIERFVGAGWCMTDSANGEPSRVVLAATFPAAIRRFREIAKSGMPAIVRGAS